MDKDIIIRLLKGEHISVTERISRGILQHPPLKFKELVNILSEIIISESYFPYEWKQNKDGEVVYEGAIIKKVSETKFLYQLQRAQVFNPHLVAEKSEKYFKGANDVAKHYLKNELHLPGDLDGFKVIK